jgi:hypothetical protein
VVNFQMPTTDQFWPAVDMGEIAGQSTVNEQGTTHAVGWTSGT